MLKTGNPLDLFSDSPRFREKLRALVFHVFFIPSDGRLDQAAVSLVSPALSVRDAQTMSAESSHEVTDNRRLSGKVQVLLREGGENRWHEESEVSFFLIMVSSGN